MAAEEIAAAYDAVTPFFSYWTFGRKPCCNQKEPFVGPELITGSPLVLLLQTGDSTSLQRLFVLDWGFERDGGFNNKLSVVFSGGTLLPTCLGGL